MDPSLGSVLKEYQSYNLENIGLIGFENSKTRSLAFFDKHLFISERPFCLSVKFLRPKPTVIRSNEESLKGKLSPLS